MVANIKNCANQSLVLKRPKKTIDRSCTIKYALFEALVDYEKKSFKMVPANDQSPDGSWFLQKKTF